MWQWLKKVFTLRFAPLPIVFNVRCGTGDGGYMDKPGINKNDYIARISNADPLQLIIINYDLILDYISLAKEAKDCDVARENVSKAENCLRELAVTLNMDYTISKELIRIYIYINGLLVNSKIKLNTLKKEAANFYLIEAAILLNDLLKGWRELETQGHVALGKRAYDNPQQLYAGLTYKNGKLTEFIDEDSKRGYKA
jgi:flagellar protein FliS